MRNIETFDNIESFTINGDERRVIHFNPSDPNILVRAHESQRRITEKQKQMQSIKLLPDGKLKDPTDQAQEILVEFDEMIRKEINCIFNSDVYDTVFAGQSPLCIVGKEKDFLFESFLKSALPIIDEGVAEFNAGSQARIERYTKGYVE